MLSTTPHSRINVTAPPCAPPPASTRDQSEFQRLLSAAQVHRSAVVGSDPRVPLGTPLCFFHGTSSASLPGILRSGLQPTGELMAAGKAPLAGELKDGLHPAVGVNNSSVSACWSWAPDGALVYAFGAIGKSRLWHPSLAEARVAGLQAELTILEAIRDAGGTLHGEQEHNFEILPVRLALEKSRSAEYAKLSPAEQAFVCDQFPVVLGACAHEGQVWRSRTGPGLAHPGECAISPCAPEQLVAFVPRMYLLKAREMASSLQSIVRVEPLSAMRSYFLGDLSCAQQGVLREAITLDATTVAEARTHLFHPAPTIVTVRFMLRMLVGMVRENADLEALSLIREFHGSSQIARREAAKAIAELGDARDLKQLRKSAWEGREYASGEDVSRSLLRALWKHGGTLGRGEALLRVALRPLRIKSLFKGLFESSEMRLSACSENAGD